MLLPVLAGHLLKLSLHLLGFMSQTTDDSIKLTGIAQSFILNWVSIIVEPSIIILKTRRLVFTTMLGSGLIVWQERTTDLLLVLLQYFAQIIHICFGSWIHLMRLLWAWSIENLFQHLNAQLHKYCTFYKGTETCKNGHFGDYLLGDGIYQVAKGREEIKQLCSVKW